MCNQKSLAVIVLCLTHLMAHAQEDGTKNKPRIDSTKKTDSAANSASKDYSGIWTWDDYVQLWPYSYDSTATQGLPVTSDINAEFVVQDFTKFKNSNDSLFILKFLYYLKDSKKVGNESKIINNAYFHRYNFSGSDGAFDSIAKKPEKVIAREFGVFQRYFYVTAAVFHAHAIRVQRKKSTIIKGALGFGVVNYPFKWRIQPHINDFSGSFNVGAAVSYTYRHDSANKWSFSHVLGIGISSVTLDAASADRDTAALSRSNTFTALTLSYGFMIQYDKVQLGLFLGWDRISNLNNTTYGWKYQGNPWISLGIGYSIFSTSTTTTSTTSKTDTQSH